VQAVSCACLPLITNSVRGLAWLFHTCTRRVAQVHPCVTHPIVPTPVPLNTMSCGFFAPCPHTGHTLLFTSPSSPNVLLRRFSTREEQLDRGRAASGPGRAGPVRARDGNPSLTRGRPMLPISAERATASAQGRQAKSGRGSPGRQAQDNSPQPASAHRGPRCRPCPPLGC
jgi:hypothetical protein